MEDRSNQTYTPRVVRARINIPARPWQAYREEYRGQGFTVNNFKAMIFHCCPFCGRKLK